MGSAVTEITGRPIVAGSARGDAITTDEPLSLWGGLNPATGEIIDRRHPLSGRIVTGGVLVLPHGRGSCSASGVLLESIRNGTAPAAFVVARLDPIIGLGAILAEELYGQTVPVLLVSQEELATLCDGDLIELDNSGRLTIGHRESSAN